MSTAKNACGPRKLPNLSDEEQDFAVTILSVGMPYENAVQAFLDTFPAYLEYEAVTEPEVRGILGGRFREMRRSTRRVAYHKIKETENTLKKLLDCIPVASPLIRLIELEQLRQDPGLKCGERVRVLSAAASEVERLTPRERKSPFGMPNPIPDLTPKTPTTEEPPTDPFGGAMMKNAHTGQETPENG